MLRNIFTVYDTAGVFYFSTFAFNIQQNIFFANDL